MQPLLLELLLLINFYLELSQLTSACQFTLELSFPLTLLSAEAWLFLGSVHSTCRSFLT